MKSKPRILLVIAAVALLCLVGWSSAGQNSSKAEWEYKVLTAYGYPETPLPNLTQLNELGKEGWELVTTRSEELQRGDRRQIKLEYYFKRRI